jgi:hypothetical protein
LFYLYYLRSEPDKDNQGWHENDRGISFKFGEDIVDKVKKIEFSNYWIQIFILVYKST